MTNWRSEWEALSARINGLLNAGQFFIRAMGVVSGDSYNVADKHLGGQAKDVVDSLQTFLDSHKTSIPPLAADALRRFLKTYTPVIKSTSVKDVDGVKLRLTALAAVATEIEYHLSDFEAMASKRTERAFLHLSQCIIANPDVRESWKNSFYNDEVACEKQGAAHLMLHGIWAFKVNAEGARSDLVFGDPVDPTDVGAVADALVLTEWKIVKEPTNAEGIAEVARKQIRSYSEGILGGLELTRFRYVVLVSEKQLPHFDDVQEATCAFRHINIAVNPDVPSRVARKR